MRMCVLVMVVEIAKQSTLVNYMTCTTVLISNSA